MSILVIAPHPDDETLGAGGTLLRAHAEGEEIHWMIVTEVRVDPGFKAGDIARRKSEITTVADAYGFSSLTKLGLPATKLDALLLDEVMRGNKCHHKKDCSHNSLPTVSRRRSQRSPRSFYSVPGVHQIIQVPQHQAGCDYGDYFEN